MIAEALWRVVVRSGLTAATVRGVAAEAGLSLGAVTPFFPGQEALQVFAMQLAVDRATERVRAVRPHGSAEEVAEQLLTAAMPLTPETREEAAVYYAFLAQARVSPSLRLVADALDDDLSLLHRGVVDLLREDASETERELLTEEVQALTEGLAFRIITWPRRHPPETARAVVRAWIAAVRRGT